MEAPNRQCRRDGAVVPLADLGEVLARFERRGEPALFAFREELHLECERFSRSFY